MLAETGGTTYPITIASSMIKDNRRLDFLRRQSSLRYKYDAITALVGLTAHARAENTTAFLALVLDMRTSQLRDRKGQMWRVDT
jgi:hypothetical protein